MALLPKFVVKKEKMYGEWFWMIYWRWLWMDFFIERCNTEDSCMVRLCELRYPKIVEIYLIK